LTENGADYSKLELVFYTADYRGVVAKTDIKEGEIALFVPYDICVTIEHAKETPFGKYMNENDVHDYLYYKSSSYIGIFLLQELHNPDSRFKAWLGLLPHAYLDSPLFFTQAEKDLLVGSPFKDLIEEEIEGLEYDYGVLARKVPGFREEFTLDEYAKM